MNAPNGQALLPIALDLIRYWEEDAVPLDELLDDIKLQFEHRIVAGVNAIVLSYFRHRCKIEKMIFSFGGTFKQRYLRFLGVVVAQMRFCNGIPAEAVANMAITYAKGKFGQATGNWMNAVLRYINNLDLEQFPDAYPEPFEKSRSYLPIETQKKLLDIELTPPPFTFRKTALELEIQPDLGEKLSNDFLPDSLFFTSQCPNKVIESDALKNGDIYIQDPATAFCISLLKKQGISPKTILDTCAAPGGKTLLCAALLSPQKIVAFDRSARRQERTLENIQLRKHHFPEIEFDVTATPIEQESLFDLVLLDVPCSNSGVIRHRPDAMYRYNTTQVNELKILQLEILNQFCQHVKKGAFMLYSSCSISQEENLQTLKAFTKENTDFIVISHETLLPAIEHDGAFAAILQRNK